MPLHPGSINGLHSRIFFYATQFAIQQIVAARSGTGIYIPNHLERPDRGGSGFLQEVPWASGSGDRGAASVGDNFVHACAGDGGILSSVSSLTI